MHIASLAQGDVTIYKKAKEYMSMSVLTSWPSRNYDWETYWHSLAGQFMREYDEKLYYKTMQRFRWRYDLGRTASGGFVWAHNAGTKEPAKAGISLALAYTAPLKTLQITGAPRSPYARDFTLPERLWGNDADLAFLTSKHHEDYYQHGEEDEIHVPYWNLPCQLSYSPGTYRRLPLKMMLKNARHARCVVRGAAAKALCFNRQYGEIEKLLGDPDPRMRRTALDGINDNHPWFTGPVVGKNALKAEQYTPAMKGGISRILSDPDEAWFVVEGALHALHHAPVDLVEKNISRILPWTKHEDWWLREAAFRALMGLQKDERLFVENLPTLIDVMIKEYPFCSRYQMKEQLKAALLEWKKDSTVGKMIVAGFTRAALESKVVPDEGKNRRSAEGTHNILDVALASITSAPETAADLAEALAKGGVVKSLDTGNLMKIVKAPDGHVHDRFIGLYPALDKVPADQKSRLTDLLYGVFRPELVRRHQTAEKPDSKLIDLIVELTELKKPISGWEPIGTPKPSERKWRYRSFDPVVEKEKLHPRIGPPKRLRDEKALTLPEGLDGWHRPEFDDGAWKSGKTPIGVGTFMSHGHGRGWTYRPNFSYENNADWGDGEFIVMRSKFDIDDLDYDYFRISILADQGYHIYLNGHKIHTYIWFVHYPEYRRIMLGPKEIKHLKKGVNTLAARGVVRFEKNKNSDGYHPVGQMDLHIEGLRESDIVFAEPVAAPSKPAPIVEKVVEPADAETPPAAVETVAAEDVEKPVAAPHGAAAKKAEPGEGKSSSIPFVIGGVVALAALVAIAAMLKKPSRTKRTRR
jgi:hypothetical protein